MWNIIHLFLLFVILILVVLFYYKHLSTAKMGGNSSSVDISTKIKEDFNKAVETGENVRADPNINGRDVWQKMEVEYLKNKKTFNIKKSYLDFIENDSGFYSELKSDYKDGIIKIGDQTIDFSLPGHFLIQLIRLPVLAEGGVLTYNKLMQIGFNIGQLKTALKTEYRDNEAVQDYVKKNNLLEMETYVSSAG
jgi:hypothetical protein